MGEARARYHHGNLREALLLHARALLAENGVAGVSLRQVASRAGVSRTAPYHHFKDKGALMAALVGTGFEELVGDMRRCAEGPGPVLERFRDVGRAYVLFALREPHLYSTMFSAGMQSAEDYPDVACIADQAFEVCSTLVAEGQASGEFGGEAPLPVALAAWSAVHGVSTLLLQKGAGSATEPPQAGPMGGIPPEQIVEGVLHTLTEGLRAR